MLLLVIGNNINFRIFFMLFPIYQITLLYPVIEVICYNNIRDNKNKNVNIIIIANMCVTKCIQSFLYSSFVLIFSISKSFLRTIDSLGSRFDIVKKDSLLILNKKGELFKHNNYFFIFCFSISKNNVISILFFYL